MFHRRRHHNRKRSIAATKLQPISKTSFPCFFEFLLAFLLQGIPCFFDHFPFFPGNFRGLDERKILAVWVVFLAFFQKQRKSRSGHFQEHNIAALHLVAQPLDPPLLRYRASLHLSHLCFSGIAAQNLPYRSRGEGVAVGIAAQAALWRVSR